MVYIFAGTVPAPCLFRVASGPNVLYAGYAADHYTFAIAAAGAAAANGTAAAASTTTIGDTSDRLSATSARASRLDMSAWLLFLQHFNGRSLLDERRWTQAAAVCLETDASAGVFRKVRPSADAEPTSWDWADFAMLQT
ncbi:hypothetical protein FJT64_005553 [Amphibalanus amphitrite]|uniref:Uncharacterized protein n=1 Tax=Amphibalanus amphitrite TaxID=1232801 RepID=A0A6A4VVX9_AMPAM|nr:hypothetical protein FJT64_005553 [Amphibalanus amphitrite]